MKSLTLIIIGLISLCLIGNTFAQIGSPVETEPPAWEPDVLTEEENLVAFGIIMFLILVIGVIVILWLGSRHEKEMKPSSTIKGKFCPHCGSNNSTDNNYCGQCQKKLP